MPAASRPKNANNAIEVALFVVTLQQPVDQSTAVKVHSALEIVANELPGASSLQPNTMVFSFGPGNALPFGEAMRFKSAPDGSHEWRVHLTGNTVQVACFKYTRFNDVWATAQRYLQLVLSVIDHQMLVPEVSLQIIDKFEYDEPLTVNNYSMEELYQRDAPYLTPQSWESGLMWHVYQGWFEPYNDEWKTLQQLNLSNVELPNKKVANIIDHRMAIRPNAQEAMTLGGFLGDIVGVMEKLGEIYQTFHDTNVQMIRNLLTPAKQQSMGMKIDP